MNLIRRIMNQKIIVVLLLCTIALAALAGCGDDADVIRFQSVDPSRYQSELPALTGQSDTEVQTYVNKLPFHDSKFRLSVYNSIAKSEYRDYTLKNPFYEVTSIDLTDVSDLTDFRLFPNTFSLTLENCDIKDYSVFNDSRIKLLTFQNSTVDCNAIKDCSLRKMAFYGCTLKNQEALNHLNLNSISVTYTKLDNIAFLGTMKHLTSVELQNADVSDYSPLENCKLDYLSIAFCQVKDFSFLEKMKSLKTAAFVFTNFTDLSCLKENKELESLNISYTYVDDLSGLSAFPKLKTLDISSCKRVRDLSPVNMLKDCKVTKLNMEMDSDNEISRAVKKLYESIGITKDMSEEEKIRKVTIKVLETVHYDNAVKDASYYNDNELKSALSGVGQCASYAGLTTALLDLAGINNYSLQGENILDNPQYLHRWNIVEAGGKWYGLDTTFLNDPTVLGLEPLKEGQDAEYYMSDLNSADWKKYHYPYAMPDIGSQYDDNLAR